MAHDHTRNFEQECDKQEPYRIKVTNNRKNNMPKPQTNPKRSNKHDGPPKEGPHTPYGDHGATAADQVEQARRALDAKDHELERLNKANGEFKRVALEREETIKAQAREIQALTKRLGDMREKVLACFEAPQKAAVQGVSPVESVV
jgi:hypothetical protein